MKERFYPHKAYGACIEVPPGILLADMQHLMARQIRERIPEKFRHKCKCGMMDKDGRRYAVWAYPGQGNPQEAAGKE